MSKNKSNTGVAKVPRALPLETPSPSQASTRNAASRPQVTGEALPADRPRNDKGRYVKRRPRPNLSELLRQFGPTWRSWEVVARAASGELGGVHPLGVSEGNDITGHRRDFSDDVSLFKSCTGRTEAPTEPVREVWCQVGRGGGKTRVSAAALVAAAFRDYPSLAPGERAKAYLLAQNRQTAFAALAYVKGIIDSNRLLKSMVIHETKSQIQLSNNVDIEVVTANFKHVRGFSIVGAVADEVAFYWLEQDAANADVEILNALRPGLARVPGSTLWVISSPYASRGALYEASKRHHSNNASKVLFWIAATEVMNPTFDISEIKRAFEEDGIRARSEYGAEFRKEGDSYITSDILDVAIIQERRVIPPLSGVRYFAFVDNAGGSGRDSASLAIAHVDKRRPEGHEEGAVPITFVLDFVTERKPPFSPSAVIKEFSAVLKGYKITQVTGDRFAGDFPVEAFKASGIRMVSSVHSKSELYRELLPLVTSGRVELLDNPQLRNQVLNLERRAARSGADSIDHARGAHDDVANAVAGAIVNAAKRRGSGCGAPGQRGHTILRWGGTTAWCWGRDTFGRCIEGTNKAPHTQTQSDDSYQFSDELWEALSVHDFSNSD